MAKLAFVQRDMREVESRAGEVASLRQERYDGARSPIQPRERDVRHKRARFGRHTDTCEQLVDLAMQRGEGIVRLDPGPQHVRPALPFEHPDPGDSGPHGRRVKRAERRRDILGLMTIDLADEAQGQVKLFVVLRPGMKATEATNRWVPIVYPAN